MRSMGRSSWLSSRSAGSVVGGERRAGSYADRFCEGVMSGFSRGARRKWARLTCLLGSLLWPVDSVADGTRVRLPAITSRPTLLASLRSSSPPIWPLSHSTSMSARAATLGELLLFRLSPETIATNPCWPSFGDTRDLGWGGAPAYTISCTSKSPLLVSRPNTPRIIPIITVRVFFQLLEVQVQAEERRKQG